MSEVTEAEFVGLTREMRPIWTAETYQDVPRRWRDAVAGLEPGAEARVVDEATIRQVVAGGERLFAEVILRRRPTEGWSDCGFACRGWDIFESDSRFAPEDGLEPQRCDSCARFEDDEVVEIPAAQAALCAARPIRLGVFHPTAAIACKVCHQGMRPEDRRWADIQRALEAERPAPHLGWCSCGHRVGLHRHDVAVYSNLLHDWTELEPYAPCLEQTGGMCAAMGLSAGGFRVLITEDEEDADGWMWEYTDGTTDLIPASWVTVMDEGDLQIDVGSWRIDELRGLLVVLMPNIDLFVDDDEASSVDHLQLANELFSLNTREAGFSAAQGVAVSLAHGWADFPEEKITIESVRSLVDHLVPPGHPGAAWLNGLRDGLYSAGFGHRF